MSEEGTERKKKYMKGMRKRGESLEKRATKKWKKVITTPPSESEEATSKYASAQRAQTKHTKRMRKVGKMTYEDNDVFSQLYESEVEEMAGKTQREQTAERVGRKTAIQRAKKFKKAEKEYKEEQHPRKFVKLKKRAIEEEKQVKKYSTKEGSYDKLVKSSKDVGKSYRSIRRLTKMEENEMSEKEIEKEELDAQKINWGPGRQAGERVEEPGTYDGDIRLLGNWSAQKAPDQPEGEGIIQKLLSGHLDQLEEQIKSNEFSASDNQGFKGATEGDPLVKLINKKDIREHLPRKDKQGDDVYVPADEPTQRSHRGTY